MRFWKREITVVCGGLTINYPDLEIRFKIEFGHKGSDICDVEIYNISTTSENHFTAGEPIVVIAGYSGDMGTIFSGVVDTGLTSGFSGVDKVCKIPAKDVTKDYKSEELAVSYSPGINASIILKDMINRIGLECGKIELSDDVVYTYGRVVEGYPVDILNDVALDCGSEVYIIHGIVNISSIYNPQTQAILLSPGTGLIGTPKRIEDDGQNVLEVECLLNYRIRAGTYIQIDSGLVKGDYVVTGGSHVANGNDFKTIIKLANIQR